MIRYQRREVFAFTRPGDVNAQQFALDVGATCAGIHMSDIPAFSYDLLWGERSICSVAN